jgi:hypothetical protein
LGRTSDGGKGADITGTLVDLFPMTVSGFSTAKDWAEISGGVRYSARTNGRSWSRSPRR